MILYQICFVLLCFDLIWFFCAGNQTQSLEYARQTTTAEFYPISWFSDFWKTFQTSLNTKKKRGRQREWHFPSTQATFNSFRSKSHGSNTFLCSARSDFIHWIFVTCQQNTLLCIPKFLLNLKSTSDGFTTKILFPCIHDM